MKASFYLGLLCISYILMSSGPVVDSFSVDVIELAPKQSEGGSDETPITRRPYLPPFNSLPPTAPYTMARDFEGQGFCE